MSKQYKKQMDDCVLCYDAYVLTSACVSDLRGGLVGSSAQQSYFDKF